MVDSPLTMTENVTLKKLNYKYQPVDLEANIEDGEVVEGEDVAAAVVEEEEDEDDFERNPNQSKVHVIQVLPGYKIALYILATMSTIVGVIVCGFLVSWGCAALLAYARKEGWVGGSE